MDSLLFKTKDQAPARLSGGSRAWSLSAGVDPSRARGGGRPAVSRLLAATPLLGGGRPESLPQLTHARRCERLAPRTAMPRRIQFLSDPLRRPARRLTVPQAFPHSGERASTA